MSRQQRRPHITLPNHLGITIKRFMHPNFALLRKVKGPHEGNIFHSRLWYIYPKKCTHIIDIKSYRARPWTDFRGGGALYSLSPQDIFVVSYFVSWVPELFHQMSTTDSTSIWGNLNFGLLILGPVFIPRTLHTSLSFLSSPFVTAAGSAIVITRATRW